MLLNSLELLAAGPESLRQRRAAGFTLLIVRSFSSLRMSSTPWSLRLRSLGSRSSGLVPAMILREGNELGLQLLDQSGIWQVQRVEDVNALKIERIRVLNGSSILLTAPKHNANLVALVRDDLRFYEIERCPNHLLNI